MAFSFFRGSHFRPEPLGGAGSAFSRFLETGSPLQREKKKERKESRIQTDPLKQGLANMFCRCQTGYILGQCGPRGLHHTAFVAGHEPHRELMNGRGRVPIKPYLDGW